jgi:hypothetical protein
MLFPIPVIANTIQKAHAKVLENSQEHLSLVLQCRTSNTDLEFETFSSYKQYKQKEISCQTFKKIYT